MASLVYYEIKKFFKLKAVWYVFITLLIWLFICGTTVKQLNEVTTFDFQVLILRIMGEFFLLSFFFAFSSYIYGLEIERKTFKILRSKTTPVYKMYIAKFICGLMYNFLILGTIFLITYLIGKSFLPTNELSIDNLNLYASSKASALMLICKLFFFQLIASAFISALAFFIAITTNKIMYAIVLTPIFTFVFDLGSNFRHFGWNKIVYLFPVNSDVIYKEFTHGDISLRMINLLVYTSILIVCSIYSLKNRDVMD